MACAVGQPAPPATPCVPVASARGCVQYLRGRGELNLTEENQRAIVEALGASRDVPTAELVRLKDSSQEHYRLASDVLLARGDKACAALRADRDDATAWEGLVVLLAGSRDRRCAEAGLRERGQTPYARDWVLASLPAATFDEQPVLWVLRGQQWMREALSTMLEQAIGAREKLSLPCGESEHVPSCEFDLTVRLLIPSVRIVGPDERLREQLETIARSAKFGRTRLLAAVALCYSSGIGSRGLACWRDRSQTVLRDMPWLDRSVRRISETLVQTYRDGQTFDGVVERHASRNHLRFALGVALVERALVR